MCRGAHRAVLTGCVDGGSRSFIRRHVFRCPAGNREFWMLRVIAASHVVVILEQNHAIPGYEKRSERLVARRKRLGRQLNAAPQMLPVHITDHLPAPFPILPAASKHQSFSAFKTRAFPQRMIACAVPHHRVQSRPCPAPVQLQVHVIRRIAGATLPRLS